MSNRTLRDCVGGARTGTGDVGPDDIGDADMAFRVLTEADGIDKLF